MTYTDYAPPAWLAETRAAREVEYANVLAEIRGIYALMAEGPDAISIGEVKARCARIGALQ